MVVYAIVFLAGVVLGAGLRAATIRRQHRIQVEACDCYWCGLQ